MVNQVVENYLATKRVKIHHEEEVDNEVEVVVIEDWDRDTSPLTELSFSSLVSPLSGALFRS
jgi:hypothetical protein